MQYLKTKNVYKASNVIFDNNKLEAYSYGWWRFVECIDGKLVFNSFAYSNSTIKHQWKVRHLLTSLGIAIDFEIEAPRGLQNLSSAISYYEGKIATLEQAIAKPRSHKAKNAERRQGIACYREMIVLVTGLIKKQQCAA